jgi:hypothetical protein
VPCGCLSLFGAATLSIFGPPDAILGRGKHARMKPEHFTGVPDHVPFPTTAAYSGFKARAFFEPAHVSDDSGVSEGYRFGKCIEGSQLVGNWASGAAPSWSQSGCSCSASSTRSP